MHKKLNAVMQMDPPGGRRRLGRNPIAEQQQQDSSSSPTDADSSNEAGLGGSSGNAAECRRSSRKKTIKFDVRDLLNKNRKSHKIQIEARIDSNAPKVGAGQVSKAELDSKQKTFIEKSAIFRRFSISENKLPPRPPPPPGALIHTIQQCVGELDQLPLEGGELNLAAISPIARRLSRTQDILTASMMKPKQVSSLIVTKLESASTSKASAAAASSVTSSPTGRRRAVVGGCVPSTSTSIPKKPQKRGRKPKAKLFSESTTESSSSNDAFELSPKVRTPLQIDRSTDEVDAAEHSISLIDDNSTTGIDLKENLDASAVTLPQPSILDDSMHNSTDDSFVAAAAEEDMFITRIHSSDESTTGSLRNSPKGRKADEISLFGRSNSTETNSSDDSEKRRRKIRIAVKRVSLTPQKSPLAIHFLPADEPIELLSSTNDENSNEETIINARKHKTKLFKGKQVETCATPPIILLESDTSNAASVSSSVIEITSVGTPINDPEQSSSARRGRSCKLTEKNVPIATTPEINLKAAQKSTVPQSVKVSPRYHCSTRNSAPHLPIETIAASNPSKILEDDAQSIEDVILLPKEGEKEGDTLRIEDELNEQKIEESKERTTSQVRSLRSAQSVQVKPPTPAAPSKRQKKSNKPTDTSAENDIKTNTEMLASEVLPVLSNDLQLESVQTQEIILSDQSQSGSLKGYTNSDSIETGVKQFLRTRRDASGENENRSSELDKQKQVTLLKQARSRGSMKQEQSDELSLAEKEVARSLSYDKELTKAEEKTEKPAVEEEDDGESTNESTDRSSTDTTTSEQRRESLRSRSTVLPTKKETPPKKISKSSTPESSQKSRRQIMLSNSFDDKSKEETNSLCSESSSIASSASSSSSSSSKTSSTSSSSSTYSSSSSEGRSTRSSRNSPKVDTRRSKSPISPGNVIKTQSNKSDSESSESSSKKDLIKENINNMRFNKLEKLRERRKSVRLRRSSSEPEKDSEENESSVHAIRHSSKTHAGRSRSRTGRGVEASKKLPKKTLPKDLVLSGLEKDKISTEESTPQNEIDVSPVNQENKSETPKTDTTISARAKSKKRTRRFVPIKYSSSESGTLSDDGNLSVEKSSMRLTRTRRKTISSASEIEDLPPTNLSPPDLALEYVRRKPKQTQIKTQELIEKKSEEFEFEKGEGANTEGKSTQKTNSLIERSKKIIRNSSKGPSCVKNAASSEASKESETDQDPKDTEDKQEVQYSEPASLTTSDSSAVEDLVEVKRQRKVTRLSLKTQVSDSKTKDFERLANSLDTRESVLKKDELVELPNKSELTNDKNTKSTTRALEEVKSISENVLNSEISQSKSPNQRKDTKLSLSLKIKQCHKQGVAVQKDLETEKPTEKQQPTATANLSRREHLDAKAPQICSAVNEQLKDDSDKPHYLCKSTSNSVSSPKFESHEETNKVPKVVTIEEVKVDENPKSTELNELSELRKESQLSMKNIEITRSENNSKDILVNDEYKAQSDSIPLDVKTQKIPRQRKPTRFSAKSPEVPKLEEVLQTDEDSGEIQETSVEKEPDLSVPVLKRTMQASSKCYISNNIEVVQQEEYAPIESEVNATTNVPELETNVGTATNAFLKLNILETKLVPGQTKNSLSDALKLAETPKRRRKPTRFSPKSPDRPTIESETVLKPLSETPIDQKDETKEIEDPSYISKSPEELQLGEVTISRFSTKNPENLEINLEKPVTKESLTPIQSENVCVPQISDVFNISLEARLEKESPEHSQVLEGSRNPKKSSESLKIQEEIKNILHVCQSAVDDITSISSTETKEQQERLLTTKEADQYSTGNDDKTKPEILIEKPFGGMRDEIINFQQKVKACENVLSADATEFSVTPVTSGEQMNSLNEIHSTSNIVSQEFNQSDRDSLVSINSASSRHPLEGEDVFKCIEQMTVDTNVSASSPTFKPELTTKKAIQKHLQSMLASLTSEQKLTTPKEATPHRKRKTMSEQQEPITPAPDPALDSPTTLKTDTPNQEIDIKVLSSDSNLSDDSMKPQEGASKIDLKHTHRRQLDSSFIESLEKSLARPTLIKKTLKKKEKDKEPIVISSLPKPAKEETKKSAELKKSETSSPKLKKKTNKESPKVVKKHSEDQTTSKQKSMVTAKTKEHAGIKLLESSSSGILNDDAMNKQYTEVLTSVLVNTQGPLVHKTKAETKFFSPEKRLIYDELTPALAKEPVSPVAVVKEKSPDLLPDPLKDIEKFIEDGVNLLKRSYKIDADDDGSLDRDTLKSDEMVTPKKCKLDENVAEQKSENSTQDDDNSNSNSECSTMTTNTSISDVDTPNGIRRSHRIKNNSKTTKCLVGRGLVRERERFSMKDDEKTIYSIDDQKMNLAEVEAKNSKFLKEMEERLSNFRVIRENEYKCERVISKEAKRMLCDCFLTHEEEERGELGCGEDCLNRLLMIECGSDCTVRDRCTNRRFNKFLYSPCRVFRTEKKGFGIMADIEILPGEFIMEYVGEVINGDEFEIRINEYSKDKNKHYYFMALRSDAVIDATAKGNISRFINHSCDPNAETQKWTVNGELRIGFFSRKSIMPGEEITFDYQYQRYGKEAQRCFCESSNCRGWIGAEPSSEEEEEYEGVDEDESEETEEEETTKTVEPVPVIPSPTPPDVALSEKQPLVPVVSTKVPAVDVEMAPTSVQPVAPSIPLTEPPSAIILEMTKELPLKKKKEKKRLLEEKLKRREPKQFLEDPDIEDEVRFLVKCGLRNQADTLRLSRLIVRAKLLETRINLLQILRQGELPCRRLFLDYHGLRLLHGWMSEVLDTRETDKSMEIRMELLSALECLPISNKTMLTDSKVYQTVRDWSNNKESHSPIDESPKETNVNAPSASSTPTTDDTGSELQKLAAKLVHTWDNLPEVFRIPKRERIEQMKEHEREADRQYKVLERGMMSGSDENRNRERFISKSGQKGRFNWSKDKERERVNERRKYAQNNSSLKDGSDKLPGSLAGESHLSKEQRRELFAAKVARDEAEKRQAEERREFDIKCRFFGLDPKRMRPENMPFCVNPSTGQWYSTDKKAISTPPSYAHVQVPVKPKSTNPEDYRLPEMDLPPLWKFAISPKGKIYYYHVKIRIPQWEPPIKILPLAGQHNTEMKNSESDSSTAGINDSSEDDIEVIKGLDPVKLQTYIEKKIEDRRLQRYNRLVEEKSISPRKEEDRLYNQMEVRKYKENKEKIRKRKEEIRRRRDIIAKQQTSVDSSNSTQTTEAVENANEALPIQDYLLSSEEEEILKAECNNSPLIDKIVQGDKIVDELDALQRKRSLKRALPIRDKYDHKKRKLDKNKDSSKSTKRSKDGEGSSSSSKYRKVREKFRCEIAGIIVQHLKPYRDESCFSGKILTDEDFNHLARKLTHFVMVKELKYCESIGQTLIVTESVKNKSREFIKKYMAKYGKVYVRPKNDPEFKDIPFL